MPEKKKDYVKLLLDTEDAIAALVAESRERAAELEELKKQRIEATNALASRVGRQEHEKQKAYVRDGRVVVVSWQGNSQPSVSIVAAEE